MLPPQKPEVNTSELHTAIGWIMLDPWGEDMCRNRLWELSRICIFGATMLAYVLSKTPRPATENWTFGCKAGAALRVLAGGHPRQGPATNINVTSGRNVVMCVRAYAPIG